MLRRLLVVLLVPLGLLSAAFALLLYFLDIPKIIDRYKPVALQAASESLNRDVEVREVRPSWFPILGVRMEGVRIRESPLVEGMSEAAESGTSDFVQLGAVEVGVAVWPALVSLGRNIQISQIRLEKPVVRVVRLADGSFNFDTIGTSTAAESGTSEKVPQEDGPSIFDRLENAHIGSVTVADGTFIYEDRAPEGVGTIKLRQVEFAAAKVGLGEPIHAVISAALGATEEQNIQVMVDTKPLPTKMVPFVPPDLEKIKIQTVRVPLSIVPSSAADLSEASLTTEVVISANDQKALTVTGPVTVHQLKLSSATSPSGKPFDTELKLNAFLPPGYAQLEVRGTQVRIGPLSAEIQGEVGLQPVVAWKNMRVDTLAPFSVAELVNIVPGKMPSVPSGRLGLRFRSTGDLNKQTAKLNAQWQKFSYKQEGMNVFGKIVLRTTVEGELSKPKFSAELDLSNLSIEGEGFSKPSGLNTQIHTSGRVTESHIGLDTNLYLGAAKVNAKTTYPLKKKPLNVKLSLPEVKLHPLLRSLKLPADRVAKNATLEANASYQGTVSKPMNGRFRVSRLVFVSGKSKLHGNLRAVKLMPLRAKLQAKASYLDLDQLLPESEEDTPSPPDKPPSDEPLLPEVVKQAVVGIQVDVKRLRYQGVDISNVDVDMLFSNGVLELKKSSIGVFGGKIISTGTTVDLSKKQLEYDLKTQVDKVQGGELLGLLLGSGKVLTGELSSNVAIAGKGMDVAHLAQHLSGELFMGVTKGRLDGINLLSETLSPLAEAMKMVKSNKLDFGSKGVTEFNKIRGRVYLQDGRMVLRSPMVLSTPKGDMQFTGGMGLDGGLALKGSYKVAPSVISALTGGKVRLKKDLPLTFRLGCAMTAPCVRGLNLSSATQTLMRSVAEKGLKKALKPIGNKLDKAKLPKGSDKIKKSLEDEAKNVLDKLF